MAHEQLAARQTRLAGATVPMGVGYCNDLRDDLGYRPCNNESELGECLGHPTPGRVYVFNETVREPCPISWTWGPCTGVGQPLSGGACPNCGYHMSRPPKTGKTGRHSARLPDHTDTCVCQGRGWIAATDGWTWLDAAMALGILFGFPGGAERGFFATVTCTVEAMPGAKLMEMEDVTP